MAQKSRKAGSGGREVYVYPPGSAGFFEDEGIYGPGEAEALVSDLKVSTDFGQ